MTHTGTQSTSSPRAARNNRSFLRGGNTKGDDILSVFLKSENNQCNIYRCNK